MRKSKFIFVISLLIIFFITGCSNGNSATSNKIEEVPTTQTIIDASGKTVVVPLKIEKIADAWQAHNEVLCMLGSGKKVVSTILTEKMRPWLYRVNPQMKNSVTVFESNSVNIEELLKTKPDIVFTPLNDKIEDKGSE